MFQIDEHEALKSPVSSQSHTNSQCKDAQALNNVTELPTESCNKPGHTLSAKVPYHQASSDFASLNATTDVLQRNPIDEVSSSRARMWDPVKDCSGPNTTQVDVLNSLPTRHGSSEQSMHPTASGFSSMSPDFPSYVHLCDQAQRSQRQFTSLETRGAASTDLPPYHQSQDIRFGYQGNAPMRPPPYPYSMTPQPFQVGHPYDQFQHSHQRRTGYEDDSTLHPHFRDQSQQDGRQSMYSGMKRAAPTDIQPRQAGNSPDHAQEYGQQYTGMESRMPNSMASHESARSWQSPSSAIPKLSTQKRSGFKQATHPPRQSFSPAMSQAMNVAQNAEILDEQANREEAMHAYEQACALFQAVIIRSSSLDERMECNAARNAYQTRLDVLLQESAARPPSPSPDDQQDDDGPGGGKPQYSLYEDWALCRKVEEGLSWQEVAETSIFKGRRKHRSLSQRKHTIGRMGPKYHEPEDRWTEEENQKLCALGDAGKTLGDIHRKFRSRNAERCLDQYFHLKGYHTTGSSRTRTYPQARHDPASYARSTESMQYPSVSIDTARQHLPQPPTTSSPNNPSAFTMRGHTANSSSSFSPFTGPRAPNRSVASMFLNNPASTEPRETRIQRPSGVSRQRRRPDDPISSNPFSHSNPEGHEHPMSFLPAQGALPTALGVLSGDGFGNPASQAGFENASAESVFNARHPGPTMASSSLSPTHPTASTSPLSSPRTVASPFGSHASLDSLNVAAKGVRKSG